MAAVDLMQLYRVADLYYLQHKTQAEISKLENISRSQISRILTSAREKGVVKIEVALPEDTDDLSLAAVLRNSLHLQDVLVAPLSNPDAGHDETSDAIARQAAAVLPRMLRGANKVGIGWGYTVYRMSRQLSFSNNGDTLFLPLIGASGNDNPYLQISSIIDHVAEHMNARSFFVNLPTFREKNIPLTAYENKRLQMLHEHWNSLDAAVFGLGTKEGCAVFFDGEVSDAGRKRIWQSEVQGDILSQFFFPDGGVLPQDESYHLNALPLATLKKINKSICLAGGEEKIEPIITAAKAGFFNILITDARTARGIYDRIRRTIKE